MMGCQAKYRFEYRIILDDFRRAVRTMHESVSEKLNFRCDLFVYADSRLALERMVGSNPP